MTGRRRLLPVATVILLTIAPVACRRTSPATLGRLTVTGQAEVTRPGEDRREITGSRALRAGDRIRIRQGTAEIRLAGARRLALRLGSDVEMQAAPSGTAGDRARPALMGGDLLVVASGDPVVVAATEPRVTVRGTARISRGATLLVATYQGGAELASGGRSLPVPALRQAALPATGAFPIKVTPLEYLASDSWDQRYLSDANELGTRLAARSQGFTAQLGANEGRTPEFFRNLFPRLAAEPGFDASLLSPSRPPGETLVGAAITLEGTRGTFAERWRAVFTFHDEGASWGLVALDQGVNRVPLLESVEAAIGRGPKVVGDGPTTTSPSGPGVSSGGGSGGGTTPTTTRTRTSPSTTVPGPGGTGATTTTTTPRPAAPTTTVPTGPLNTGAPLVDNTVNSLVDTLTGLLRSLGP